MQIDLNSLISALVAALLSGGFVASVLKYKLGGRQLSVQEKKLTADERQDVRDQARSDFELILGVITRQRDDAIARADKLESKIDLIELEVQGLRLARELDPFPNWIVDLEGRYIFVNRAFEREFLDPLGQGYRWAIGKSHKDVWGEEVAAKIRTLDDAARRRPDRRARAVIGAKGHQLTIHKFPHCVHGVPVAWAGYVTEIE